jgi:restriction system protein
MAKRRRRRKYDPIEDILKFSFVAGFFLVFTISKSLQAALIAAILCFAASIAVIISLRMKKNEMLKRSGIKEVDKMDGIEFEYYLSYLFQTQGYRTEVTRAAGDFGADLVISGGGKRIVVQAKRYATNVGIKAVQEVQASIAHYKASNAWVVTNSDYTEAAYTLAKSNGVRLINRQQLIEMMLALKSKATSAPASKNVAVRVPDPELCIQCGEMMVERKSTKGPVLACSNYPICKNVKFI